MDLCIGEQADMMCDYQISYAYLTLLCRKPGREETWCPTVLGMVKRDLLREVLSTFGE